MSDMERDMKIVAAYNDGMSVSVITKKFYMSRRGVYHILKRNNVVYRTPAGRTTSPQQYKRYLQAQTLKNADLNYFRYTDAELAIVEDYSLSTRQVAVRLNRSVYAIKGKREKLRLAARV